MILPIKCQKPVKVGNSYYFTIPSQYVSNGLVDVSKYYDLRICYGVLKGLRPIKVGDSHYFSICIEKIRDESIKVNKEYDIDVLETIKKKKGEK